ncbi:FkbM family methyltransferase, partial [Candidatus Woesearchaeota archaeon]|nr:FkbM family methyltransferase [Candidatus Woesearchaeota archaeon]
AYAIYAALNAKKVFAFEPHPANYKLMLHNIKQNKIKNIKAAQKAVSAKTGKIKLFVSKVNTGMHSLYETDSKKAILVDSTTVPEILTKYGISKIDILKIDAEGAEYDIILNLPQKTLKKINTIILEYHDYLNLRHNLNDVKTYLRKQGYRVNIHGGWIMNKIFKEGYVIAKRI